MFSSFIVMQPVLRASDPQADLCLLGTVYFAQECAPESEAIRIAFHGGVEKQSSGVDKFLGSGLSGGSSDSDGARARPVLTAVLLDGFPTLSA